MTTRISVPVTTVWTGADAPRPQDAPIIAPEPDPDAWNRALLDAPPSALHGRTVTQALLGEPVQVRGERNGWAEVILPWQPSSADPDGYPGWVPATHLVESDARSRPDRVVVTAPTVAVGASQVSYGTILDVVDRSPESVRVAMPGDGEYTLDATTVVDVAGSATRADAETMLDSARGFVGLRYLWGGTSAWGMDCSGFVHLVHRRFGITVPRDAFDQIVATTRTESAAPGDLYFFARSNGRISHVGFATSAADPNLAMLHAPDDDRFQYIEEGPMAQSRRDRLAGAGSFLA